MSRSSTLILFGVVTILTPLSGFPMAFRSLLTIACGAVVLAIGLTMRTRTVQSPSVDRAPTPSVQEEEISEPKTPRSPTRVSPI